jgi:hypothetical protein
MLIHKKDTLKLLEQLRQWLTMVPEIRRILTFLGLRVTESIFNPFYMPASKHINVPVATFFNGDRSTTMSKALYGRLITSTTHFILIGYTVTVFSQYNNWWVATPHDYSYEMPK